MLPTGGLKKFFYLGIEFTQETPYSPKQEIQQQAVTDAYPEIRGLVLKGSENPNLMPEDAMTVRIHSVEGWGANSVGKNLAMTLFDLLDYQIKATAKTEGQSKGQPSTYYLSVSKNPIRSACELSQVDVVIAADPTIFNHSNPLEGLRENGVLILQTEENSSEKIWRSLPRLAQQYIVNKKINLASINGFKISNKLQNVVFQGAFFKVATILEQTGKTAEGFLEEIQANFRIKFSDNQQTLDDHLTVLQHGFDKVQMLDVSAMKVGDVEVPVEPMEVTAPLLLLQKSANDEPLSDIHRFFEQTGSNYINGKADNLADPFVATNIIPAATGIYRDMTSIRLEHPQWIAENCNACGNCYAMCPDSAIPGLINTVNEVFETNITRLEKTGKTVKHLRRAIRIAEKKYHALTATKTEGTHLQPLFARAIGETIKGYPEADQEAVSQEFELFQEAAGDFKFALTKPYHDDINQRTPNQGGLFSITINPMACKGCMECVEVCETEALKPVKQTPETIKNLRHDWQYWNDLPTSNLKYKRIDNLDEKLGVLDTLLLDKKNYHSMHGGDDACLGAGEKTVIHLFTSTVSALMQPRVKKHVVHIDSLIVGMEKNIRLKLAQNLDITDIEAIESAIEANKNVDLTLSKLSSALDEGKPSQPIDSEWLKWASQIVAKLKHLKWQYTQGTTGNGRAEMGISNSTTNSISYPFNPYPFPWASHLSEDAPSLAMGLFEGHMLKMAEGFKTIRMAELEISGKYNPETSPQFFSYFDWHQFSDEEYLLSPPIVSIGNDDAMYDDGFQSLSNCILSGMPIKILILDSQSGSSNFINDHRKEMSLIAMAHQSAFTLQSSIAHTNHLLEGYIDGLNYRGAAVFTVYSANQSEHGIANDAAAKQSKLAVEARAYPLMSFDPRTEGNWESCLSLQGNPEVEKDWTSYTLNYMDEYGVEETMEIPLTFADWALTEGRFGQYFHVLPPSKWSDDMIELVEFIDLSAAEQADNTAFIHAIHPETNTLIRVTVAAEIVSATMARRDFWRTLKGLAGLDRKVIDPIAVAAQAKAEVAQSFAASLMNLAGGDGLDLSDFIAAAPVVATAPIQTSPMPTKVLAAETKPTAKKKVAPKSGHDAVWIETPDCTTCDECVDIAPAIFKYNDDKKAVVINPTAGTYEQIVKAAERCTAVIIHPGTPWNTDEKNLEKLIKRAEKFQ